MNKNKILVNIITGMRVVGSLLLVPVFLKFGIITTAFTYIGFILTDLLDGYLARKLNVSSFFGALLDGISDKLFAFISLSIVTSLNSGMIFPLILESAIFLIGSISLFRGKNLQSSIIGKTKIWVLGASIFILLLSNDYNTVQIIKGILSNINIDILNKSLISITTTIESATLIDYLIKEKTQVNEEKENIQKEDLIDKEDLKYRLFNTNYYINHKNDSLKLLLKKGNL